MPAGKIVVLGHLIEAVRLVQGRIGELGGVDHATLERRIDVGTGQQLGRTPSLSMTLAPSPKKRIFTPLRSSRLSIGSRNQPDDWRPRCRTGSP